MYTHGYKYTPCTYMVTSTPCTNMYTHTHHVQIFIAMSDTNSLFTKTTFKTMATAIGRHLNGVTIIVHL